MDLDQAKYRVNLVDVSKLSNKQLVLGYQDCVFCKGKSKLKVTKKTYKCFNPSCGKHGDIFNYLVDCNPGYTYKDAITMVYTKLLKISSSSAKDWYRSTKTYSKAFEIYKNNNGVETIDFLNSRGFQLDGDYARHIQKNVGFACNRNLLSKSNLDQQELRNLGLVYGNGRDYYSNRIVFRVEDHKGNTVAFNARSIDPSEELRYKSTKTPANDSLKSIPNYFYNEYEAITKLKHSTKKILCLCEGVPDAISLIQLGLTTVGIFGVNVSLANHTALFKEVKTLYVFIDGDRFSIGTRLENQYKSWSQLYPYLVELQLKFPELKIVCCPPKNYKNIKDINDWYKEGLSKLELSEYVKTQGRSLLEFGIDEFSPYISYHADLIKLANRDTEANKIKLQNKIINKDTDLIKYLEDYADTLSKSRRI